MYMTGKLPTELRTLNKVLASPVSTPTISACKAVNHAHEKPFAAR